MLNKLKMLEWSARKLKIPSLGSGLALDVGSGGNPSPFADVLLEKYIDNTHRFKPIKIDRPIVLADAAKMPFKNNAFSYVMAYHILEHLHQPVDFLEELQRVGEGGYIETPNALYERIHPFSVHLLEIFLIDDTLHIYKKKGPVGDDFIGEINLLDHDPKWRKFFYANPRLFHNCYYWNGEIKYKMVNPDAETKWFDDPSLQSFSHGEAQASGAERSLRGGLIKLIRKYKSKTVDLDSILACPECKTDVARDGDYYICQQSSCARKYAATPIPDFNIAL